MRLFNKILFLCFTVVSSVCPDAASDAIPKFFGMSLPDLFKNIELLSVDKRFQSNKDQRDQVLQKTENFLDLLKKDIQKIRNEVQSSVTQLQSSIDELETVNVELVDKKNFDKKKQILEARLKINNEILETLKLIESSIELNMVYARGVEEPVVLDKATHSFDDIFKIEDEIVSIAEKKRNAKAKKEKVLKLISSINEKIIVEKKDLESILAKKNKILKSSYDENGYNTDQKYESILLKIDLKNDTIRLLDLKARRLSLESINIDDEIFLLNKARVNTDLQLEHAKQHLFISSKDLLIAKERNKEKTKMAVATKEQNQGLIDSKNKEKLQLEELVERSEASLKTLALKNSNKKTWFVELSKAELVSIQYKRKINEIDKDIRLLELESDIAEIAMLEQKFKMRGVEAFLGMRVGDFNLKRHLELMREEKRILEANIKNYESINYLEAHADDTSILRSQIKMKLAEFSSKNNDPRWQNKEMADLLSDFERELEAINSSEASQRNVHSATLLIEILQRHKLLKTKYSNLIRDISDKFGEREIWTRSPQAISLEDLTQAMHDAEDFFVQFFWMSQTRFSPSYLISVAKSLNFNWLLGFGFLILLICLLFFVLRGLFDFFKDRLKQIIFIKSGHTNSLLWIFLSGLIEFIEKNFFPFFTWLSIYFLIKFQPIEYFGISIFNIDSYLVAAFYLFSIPIFLVFSKKFLEYMSAINQKMSYFFFNEKSQYKNYLLSAIFVYAGSILMPLRMAFVSFGVQGSKFPAVILAAHTLIFSVIFLMFFDRDDLLGFFPKHGRFFAWIKAQAEKYYNPVFLFLMTIFIIYNPYVGYFNLAWKLLLLVPVTFALVWALFFAHEYLRNNLLPIFVIEDDDGTQERFENAKLLYSFLIVLTFFVATFVGVFLGAKIWGLTYSLEQIWQFLNKQMVLRINDDGDLLGVIQVCQFLLVMFVGFLLSSICNNYLLTKLFDAFDTEPGLQNTVTRISHYLIIFSFVIIGLSTIGFNKLVFPALTLLFFGIAFALKDQVSDIAGGIFILLERQFEIGHFIEIASEGIRGTVTKISFRSTVIKTTSNFFIAVPNRILISKPVVNWGMGKLAIAIEVEVEVDYASDPEQVRHVIFAVLDAHEMILKSPTPVVRLERFQPSGALFLTKAFFSSRRVREFWNLQSDIRLGILNGFKVAGIKIPFPHRIVSVQSGDRSIFNAPENDFVKIKILNGDNQEGNSEESPIFKP